MDKFNRRGARWCFCLVVTTIDLVFSGWIDVHFFVHQLLTSSSPSWRSELSSSILLDAEWIDESSANKELISSFLRWRGRSLIYKRNRSGPRTDPCGTPVFMMPLLDVILFTFTNWCLFSRKDLIKSIDGEFGRYRDSFWSRIEWLTRSKAFLKSKYKVPTTWALFTA